MSAYFQSPLVTGYNTKIMASQGAKFVLAVVIIVTVLITSDTLPHLRPSNKWIVRLNSTPVRLVLLALTFYYMKTEPTVAFILAGFLLTCIHWYSQARSAETFVSLAYQAQNQISPACANVTANDLLTMFNGNSWDLQRTARLCGVPPGVEISDLSAPFIATMLLASGISITPSCSVFGADPSLTKANSQITMPVVALPEIAQVQPISTNIVAGDTSMSNGMMAMNIAAPIVGTETVHLASLH